MDCKPMNNDVSKPGMILEGSIGFENEGIISSYSNYWTQIVRINDSKIGA